MRLAGDFTTNVALLTQILCVRRPRSSSNGAIGAKEVNKELLWRWSMWHSSLQKCLLAPQPVHCFSAVVQIHTPVCLGRDPAHQLMLLFLSICKVRSVYIKPQYQQPCWLKHSATTGCIYPWAPGPAYGGRTSRHMMKVETRYHT